MSEHGGGACLSKFHRAFEVDSSVRENISERYTDSVRSRTSVSQSAEQSLYAYAFFIIKTNTASGVVRFFFGIKYKMYLDCS